MQSCLGLNASADPKRQTLAHLDTAMTGWSAQPAYPHAFNDTDEKWPAWKSAWFIIGVCGSFWAAVILGVSRIF